MTTDLQCIPILSLVASTSLNRSSCCCCACSRLRRGDDHWARFATVGQRALRHEANRYLRDWLTRSLGTISRADAEARFNSITADHGWWAANRAMFMLRSIYRRPCVDYDGLRNRVDLWLAGGGKFHRKARRKISAPAEVLPCWHAGFEAEVNNPAIRDARWFGLYKGMRRDEVLTLRRERVHMDALAFRVKESKIDAPLERRITNQLAAILEHRRAAAADLPEGVRERVFPSPTSATGDVQDPSHLSF